jgi:anti-sigma B factor antagonist
VPRRELRIERPNGAAVVALLGEHDEFTALRLRETLDTLLDEPTPVVVDFGEATFVDSTTVATLIGARRRAEKAGVELKLAVPASAGPHVLRLFETTHLDAVFSIYATRAAALKALRH